MERRAYIPPLQMTTQTMALREMNMGILFTAHRQRREDTLEWRALSRTKIMMGENRNLIVAVRS